MMLLICVIYLMASDPLLVSVAVIKGLHKAMMSHLTIMDGWHHFSL